MFYRARSRKKNTPYKAPHDYELPHRGDKSLEIDLLEAVVSLIGKYFID